MSGVVEREKDYPAFVDVSPKAYALVLHVVESCQAAGFFGPVRLTSSPSPCGVSCTAWSHSSSTPRVILECVRSNNVRIMISDGWALDRSAGRGMGAP